MQSLIQVGLVIFLLALLYPPVLVVPLLAILPGLADRRAARIQKRSDDDLADKRRLGEELFTLASTAGPARELRTFGITTAVIDRHARLGDEVNAQSLRAARRSACWEALGWAGYAAGFAVAVIAIRFDGVGFTYPGRSEGTLRDINLTLAAGTTVAIVGENGAGKTTLVKLLTGMYRPTGGAILVDGTDLAQLDPVQWRRATTATFQDFVRFHMSLGDGVGLGDLPHIDDQLAIGAALDQAGATSLVAEMPDGLETLLGPYIGGRSLSGGQWQRLALARGLMRTSPVVVVLDEPTASFDAPSEAALFARYRQAAQRLGRANGAITVLVSHRFSTVHMADQIVVMDGGRIVEAGNHADLLARRGLYAELFNLQASGYRASV